MIDYFALNFIPCFHSVVWVTEMAGHSAYKIQLHILPNVLFLGIQNCGHHEFSY